MLKRKILKITLSIFLGAVIISLFLFIGILKANYVVPILMYHSVDPNALPENKLSVSRDSFERQMNFLKKHRYHVIPLDALAVLIKDKKKIPARTLSITLDDGYKDNFTYAFPILKKYHLPATMFIIVNEVGRPQGDRLSWEEIKIMQDSGIITFGSHCLGPEPLVKIKSDSELKAEIFDSKRALEEKLAQGVVAFSYPEGRFNAKIKQLVKDAGYKLAVTTSPGKKFADDDVFALKRLRISSTSDNLFVFWIETSGFYTFIKEHRDED